MMKKTILVGLSGVLLSVMVGCSQKAVEKPVTGEVASSSELLTETSETGTEATTADSQVKSSDVAVMTVAEVIEIYEKEHPETDITSIDLEKELKGFVYSIEGVDDEKEYELEINAETKELIKNKQEKLDKDEKGGVKREADKLDLVDILSVDEATEIAEKEVGTGNATGWDLDRELNTTYWKVNVEEGRKETQVKLDAKTGEILEVELDD